MVHEKRMKLLLKLKWENNIEKKKQNQPKIELSKHTQSTSIEVDAILLLHHLFENVRIWRGFP